MKPPAIARALLLTVAGEAEAEYVAGDLEEEYALVCQARDRAAGTRWYLWQVLRSVAPLLGLRLRSGALRRPAVGAVLGVAIPLLLLDRLWCFVYSQIPLKDGLDRAPEFLVVNVISVCVGAAINGSNQQSNQSPLGPAISAAAAAGLAMCASAGRATPWYAALLLLTAPASSLATLLWRRSR